MSVLWADGFDHWGSNNAMTGASYVLGENCLQNNAGNARTGNNYILITNDGGYGGLSRQFAPNNVYTVGVAIKFDTMGTDDAFPERTYVTDGGGDVGAWYTFYGDGSISINSALDGTELGRTPINTYGPNTWNYFELLVDVPNGRVAFRVNNIKLIDVIGNLGVGQVSKVSWFSRNRFGSTRRNFYLDDFYITNGDGPAPNNGFLGDVRCRTLFATQNGPDQAWTVTGADNAVDAINSVPFDPTKYIAAQNVGDLSDFVMGLVPANTSYCSALVCFTTAAKTDAGICQVTPELISNGQSEDLAAINPAVAMATYVAISEADPVGNYWTKDTVNSLRFGIKRTA